MESKADLSEEEIDGLARRNRERLMEEFNGIMQAFIWGPEHYASRANADCELSDKPIIVEGVLEKSHDE